MSKRALWLIIVCLLLATGLRAWEISSQSIWFDEAFSWHAASQPNLLATINGDPTNPPLYYLLLHGWVRLVGDSEFALRAFSLVQGIILLALMSALGRRWFGVKAGVLAAALGAFLPLLWWASQEARMYNTLAIAALLMAAGLMAILTRRQPTTHQPLTRGPKIGPLTIDPAWVLLLLGELAVLYTHNTGVTILGALNLVFAGAWLVDFLRGNRRWVLLRHWIAGQIAVVILWLPELLARFLDVSGANAASHRPPQLSLELLANSWQALWGSSWEMVIRQTPELAQGAALALPLLILALLVLRVQRGRLLMGLVLALYAGVIGGLVVLGVNLHGRYLITLTPLLVIAMAAGLAQVTRPRWLGTGLSLAAVLLAGYLWLALPGQANPDYQHDQAREMVQYYAGQLSPDDVVITWSYADRYDLRYYWDREGVAATLITLPEGADAATAADRINAHLTPGETVRAEINTWFAQTSDTRGMLPCLLGHGQPPPGQTWTVYGMTTTTYALTAPLDPLLAESMEPPAQITPVRLEGAYPVTDSLPADRGICLPVAFTLTDPTPELLRAAIKVVNDQGREIASADTFIYTSYQEPTSQLTPGALLAAYPLVRLPQGTPPGDYTLNLRVYSEEHLGGFDWLHPENGQPIGRDVPLGTLTASAGSWPPFTGDCTLAISPDLTLTNCAELPTGNLPAGGNLQLTLKWQASAESGPVTLALSGDGWTVTNSASWPVDGAVLDWRTLAIPDEASGPATLTAQVAGHDPVTLAEVTIE